MTTPFVSVVIPVYNNEKYLRECLDSVVNQTLKEIEIICVNDGSTDGCADILNQYALKDNRIRVIHKNNTGYGHSMNVGMAAATGEYIAIVESDDYIEPKMMEILYNIGIREKVDMVKADFACVYGDGENRFKQVCKAFWDKSVYNKIISPDDLHFKYRNYVANWAGIYKRDFLNKFNIRHNETPGASYQDVGFWFQVYTQASKIYITDHVFYMYRQDNPNASVRSKGKVYCICDEMQFVYNFLKEHPELYKKYIYIYQFFRYGHYNFTYKRIANEFKLVFLYRFQEDFLEANNRNELDLNLFNPQEQQNLQLIMSDPEEYYRKDTEFPRHISNLVKEYSEVIIYGAGMKGREVLNALRQSDAADKLVCFAVSSLENNNRFVDGVIVKETADLLEYRQNAAIIVAVTEIYRDEILQTLKDLKFKHPILIS